MRAIVKSRPIAGSPWEKGLRFEKKAEPFVTRDEDVIIQVHAGAICGTDVGIYNGKESLRHEMERAVTNPVTIGHEFSGRIVDAGKGARKHLARLIHRKAASNADLRSLLGKKTPAALARDTAFAELLESRFHATAEMHVTCGMCYQCRKGEKHVCRNTIIKGVHDDGAWAEYVKVPAENVRLFFGEEIHPDVISFMDALGNAAHTVFSTRVKGSAVAVLGCGVQGLMAVAVARHAGARKIYVTDASSEHISHERLVERRFSLAQEYGADACFDMALEDQRKGFIDTVFADTDGTGVDAVYEMSGSYHAYRDALRAVRMGGEIALLGIPSGEMELDFANDVIFHGLTIRGIIGRKVFQTWDQMEELLRNGMADTFLSTGFISHEFPLEEFENAFDVIRRGDAYKVLLKPGLEPARSEVDSGENRMTADDGVPADEQERTSA